MCDEQHLREGGLSAYPTVMKRSAVLFRAAWEGREAGHLCPLARKKLSWPTGASEANRVRRLQRKKGVVDFLL